METEDSFNVDQLEDIMSSWSLMVESLEEEMEIEMLEAGVCEMDWSMSEQREHRKLDDWKKWLGVRIQDDDDVPVSDEMESLSLSRQEEDDAHLELDRMLLLVKFDKGAKFAKNDDDKDDRYRGAGAVVDMCDDKEDQCQGAGSVVDLCDAKMYYGYGTWYNGMWHVTNSVVAIPAGGVGRGINNTDRNINYVKNNLRCADRPDMYSNKQTNLLKTNIIGVPSSKEGSGARKRSRCGQSGGWLSRRISGTPGSRTTTRWRSGRRLAVAKLRYMETSGENVVLEVKDIDNRNVIGAKLLSAERAGVVSHAGGTQGQGHPGGSGQECVGVADKCSDKSKRVTAYWAQPVYIPGAGNASRLEQVGGQMDIKTKETKELKDKLIPGHTAGFTRQGFN